MEKTYKRVPFDIELAKKIQSGNVAGRIVTREGKLARILCDDFYTNDVFKVVAAIRETNSEKIIRVNANGDYNTTTCSHMDLVIELPEKAPKLDDITTKEGFYKAFSKHEFKAGDEVKIKGGGPKRYQISSINGNYACFTYSEITYSTSLDNLQYVGHEFKPFDKVLVRNRDNGEWHPSLYATTDGLLYYTIDCKNWQQCIPYEGNEKLVGTTNKPKEK